MASQSTTFGATIVPTANPDSSRRPPNSLLDSPAITPAVSRDGSAVSIPAATHHKVTSPFYEHPPASHERMPTSKPLSPQDSQDNFTAVSALEKGAESGLVTPSLAPDDKHPFTSQISVDCQTKECTMWPSKQTLMQKKKDIKMRRRDTRPCAPWHRFWARFDNRQRLWIKIAIAVFLVGAAVAIGVGITIAVHGGVWSSNGDSKQIPS